MALTDSKIFEHELVCIDCRKPVPAGDRAKAGECQCGNCNWQYKDYRMFLDGAGAVKDVHVARAPDSTDCVVDIPQRFVYHSPTGFEYGYGGSGPADLALNILGLFVAPPEAWRLHQRFKWEVIAPLDRAKNHTITAESVRDWITAAWQAEPARTV